MSDRTDSTRNVRRSPGISYQRLLDASERAEVEQIEAALDAEAVVGGDRLGDGVGLLALVRLVNRLAIVVPQVWHRALRFRCRVSVALTLLAWSPNANARHTKPATPPRSLTVQARSW